MFNFGVASVYVCPGDGGPLSISDESRKIERLITLDTSSNGAHANEGYLASKHTSGQI